MKHLVRFCLLAFSMVLVAQTSSALVFPSAVDPVKTKTVNPSPFAGMTMKDFLALTPKKYKELTGKRLSVSQKISLKIAQYKVKKAARHNKGLELYAMPAVVDTSDFSIGGFVLGLLLPVIGVLIAYLIGDAAVIKWAWIGFAVWAAIFLLVLIL